MLMYSIVNLTFYAVSLSINAWWIMLLVAQVVPMFTFVPRFILNLRALHARDCRGSNIDTAFGLMSVSSHAPVVSAIVFAEGGENEGEEMEMEERDIWSVGSGA